ncbi:YhzD family protein [Texcoconibacillus texcoconensis]|uniref:YhzD-like protein n=1 Tax=Texcoconibacillus texcoconensis TaxID=1095777 RepID=A0A840QPC7_9BACI|nr:YhzD family protein [Texcoconibacillus texcoconensis]MBB5173252.1 hypothetical protein [Texcoconibacillus texcoconensis]
MGEYIVTAFDSKGKTLLNESFEAISDNDAKSIGLRKLKGENLHGYPARVTRSSAGLVYFHS